MTLTIRDHQPKLLVMFEKPRTATNDALDHVGSSLDDFLEEEGIREETQAQALAEVITWKTS